jgi:predicted O-methyltransferase YrrM
MTSSLNDSRIRGVLEEMHSAADRDDPPLLEKARGKRGAERAVLLDDAFIPVSADAGRLLYVLARGAQAGAFVEFGTSFGISTIYLATAVRDRGAGRVVTTEINAAKAQRASRYIEAAGLADLVDLRVGDALETIANIRGGVSLAFLDGWKELYLPFLKRIEPALQPGAFVIADDLDLFPDALREYLSYVRDPMSGYVSAMLPVGDAMEVSVRTG